MAERCALLIIIALGEGILLTGATFLRKANGIRRWLQHSRPPLPEA